MTYTISTLRTAMQPERVHEMLAAAYWSPQIRRDIVVRAMDNSLVAGAFTPSGVQVGYARVVTDSATFAWLCDVIVEEPHRGRGLSRRMLDALHGLPQLAQLRRWCLATRDAHGLYASMGYVPVVPGAWMERKGPIEVWQDPS